LHSTIDLSGQPSAWPNRGTDKRAGRAWHLVMICGRPAAFVIAYAIGQQGAVANRALIDPAG
jgi:hypothetical protein